MKLSIPQKIYVSLLGLYLCFLGVILLLGYLFYQYVLKNYSVLNADFIGFVLEPVAALIILLFFISLFITRFLVNSFMMPISRISETTQQMLQGKQVVSTRLKASDGELHAIGASIDNLYAKQITVMEEVDRENESIREAINSLLATVARLANKELSAKAKTGNVVIRPVADALNFMAQEISRMMRKIIAISSNISEHSLMVKKDSNEFLKLSIQDNASINNILTKMFPVVEIALNISSLAKKSDKIATEAVEISSSSASSAEDAVYNIKQINDTIYETEKRIKLLGERSQEISTAVNLISNISERTQVLALNASMQAVAAGEVGSGFLVVADEVKRLADNVQEATEQISMRAKNIQVETMHTAKIMNHLVSQIAAGSKLAEEVNRQMEELQRAIVVLSGQIKDIVERSNKQVEAGEQFNTGTNDIEKSINRAVYYIKKQTVHINEFAGYAVELMALVDTFEIIKNAQNK